MGLSRLFERFWECLIGAIIEYQLNAVYSCTQRPCYLFPFRRVTPPPRKNKEIFNDSCQLDTFFGLFFVCTKGGDIYKRKKKEEKLSHVNEEFLACFSPISIHVHSILFRSSVECYRK